MSGQGEGETLFGFLRDVAREARGLGKLLGELRDNGKRNAEAKRARARGDGAAGKVIDAEFEEVPEGQGSK